MLKPSVKRLRRLMYIFLDFDGVLRRLSSDPSRLEKDCLENFEAAVRPLPNAKIVISSAWRLVMPFKELRGFFAAEVADKIVGVTPEITLSSPHARYEEIRAYLKGQNTEDEIWVAIDDDPKHFPKDAPVILTSPDEGFDSICVNKLWEYAATEYK